MITEVITGSAGELAPLKVQGNSATGAMYVEVLAGGTGGTQYTEDAAAAANPVGTSVNLIRQDTPAALTTADGDNVAQRGTDYGAAFTQIVTSAGAFVDTFGGGTQYTEGDTDATITGTALLFESNTGTNALSVVNATTPLPVTLPAAEVTNIDNIESYTSRLTSSAGPKTSGAPLATTAFQIGGTYNATPPTMTDTHEGGLQLDVNGNLKAVVASHAVTNAGTFAVQATVAAGATNIAKAEDVASADADVGVPAMAVRKATPANTSGTDGDYEMLQMSAGRLWVSAFNEAAGHSATVTITRPSDTTAYTAGDVIGDTGGSAIFEFTNMAKTGGGEVMITSIELELDVGTLPGIAGTNVRLYNASPTAIADNAAWDLPSGDRGKYLGKVLLGTPVDEGSTCFIDNDGINKQIKLTSTSLYVELQTIGAFTPTSAAVKRLTIHTLDI